jgi:hypothetical protein
MLKCLVFPVPEGNCNGLYVSRKGPHRFVVEELNGGKSSTPFSYRVVSRRRDAVGKRLETINEGSRPILDVPPAPAIPKTPTPPGRDR